MARQIQSISPFCWAVWGSYALILLLAPAIFRESAQLTVLCTMGTAIILALSCNMLLGEGGMLTFGHAVYSGLGAFCAIHAMNQAAEGMALPLALVPLVGGLAGMGFGLVFGFFTTRKGGATFAMLTLGIAELVYACSLLFDGFFGGEGGIMANRVYGQPFLGITYGPQIEVYYLIAAWLLITTIGIYGFTRTPLGRLLNAVRDNPERAEFIGYNPHLVRYLSLVASAFFAGISGGLAAINFELVSVESVSAARSATILLFTYIGGTGYFFGPVLGAIAGVLLTVVLPNFTKAWPMYIGLFFILTVMYVPRGLAGIGMMGFTLIRSGKLRQAWPDVGKMGAAVLLLAAGAVLFIEMIYHHALGAVDGGTLDLFGIEFGTGNPVPWLVAAMLAMAGGWVMRLCHPGFLVMWNDAGLMSGDAKAKEGT